MTKRIGNFDEKTNKKAKLDDDIEALWGDDIDVDEDALDNCIKLATQVCKEDQITSTQQNNVTLLPSYSGFKTRSTLLSSTQLSQFGNNNVIRPGTSKNHINSNNFISTRHLEGEIKTLQQNYAEKEGEVSILRMQLQETKEQQQKEQHRLQNEWKQKIARTEKQVKSVRSELEFKDLEISNLKQTILKITKHNIFDSTYSSPEKATTSKVNEEKTVLGGANTQRVILQPMLDPIYPLKDVLSDTIFNVPKKEQHITLGKLVHTCRNTIPYLHNQLISANVALNKSNINVNCIYSDIFKVLRLTDGEFDKKENFKHMNKIIYACEQFLYDLDRFLQKIKSNLRTEDVLESDSNYLKQLNSSSNVSGNRDGEEIGVKSSVLLDLIAEILPYSEYLQKYICRDEKLASEDHEESLIKQFPYQIVKHQNVIPYYLLNTTLSVIKTAGEIRKVNFMTKFVCATIKLLVNIHKSRNYDYVSDIFCKLTKEMILSRPPVEVICQITSLFKLTSQHSSFVEFLLNKSQNSVTNKKGLLYFNADACRFYIFVMLFDNVIFNLSDEDFPINVCLNVLCFMYNTFKNCHWVHHRNAKGCECVSQLYKLTIEIIARALERYVEETKKLGLASSKWAHFFKNPITAKVLHLMTFNSYELTEKYITVFSHYKQIEKRLQEEENVIPLEKLNITEEIPEIPSDAFANIDF